MSLDRKDRRLNLPVAGDVKRMCQMLVVVGLGVLYVSEAYAQDVIYVDRNAAGSNNGESWADGFEHLQDALDAAQPGDEIWVAQGTYHPDEGESVTKGDRSATFLLQSGLRLFGGFSGVETRRVDRRVDEYKTILSGDLAADDTLGFVRREDNALHVVSGVSVDSTALIDGFFITGGYALGIGPGMFSQVSDSVGAGILLVDASPALFNLTIIDNRAYAGGGLYSRGSRPVLANVVVGGNRARRGGGVFLDGSAAWIGNSTVVNNYAEVGAGLFNRSSEPLIANSILYGNGPAGDPDSVYECERLAYPCTYRDVALRIRQRSRDLADSAYVFATAPAMISWLRSKPEVEAVGGSEDVVRFRITGGRPMWVLLEHAVSFATSNKQAGQTGSAPLLEVAGRDRNDDGKVSNRDGRHALILDPFNGEWGASSDGQMLDQKLAGTPGYERLSTGQVDWLKDSGVTPEVFARWDDYELVHVSTHGDGYCEEDDPPFCYTFLSTGVELKDVGMYPQDIFAPQTVTVPARVVNGVQRPRQYYLGLGEEWFTKAYSGKKALEKTMVFLNACKTHNPATVSGSPPGIPYFMTSLMPSSTTSAVLVWTNPVPVVGAHVLATEIYEESLQNGRTIGNVMADLRQKGDDVLPNSEATTQLKLVGNEKLRLREIVFLLSEAKSGRLFQDGDDLSPHVDGVFGDNRNDHLELSVRLDGVEENDIDKFRIQFYLDGSRIGSEFTPSQADEKAQVDGFPNSFILLKRVAAGRDFKLNEEYDLEVVAKLPDENAESRYEVTATTSPCFWRLTMGGTRAGEYSGNSAWFSRPVESQFNLQFNPLTPDDPIVAITSSLYRSVPMGVTGSYELGADEVGDGFGQIAFSIGELPNLYLTGDGSEEKDENGNVIFVYPGPSTLNIAHNDSTVVQGSISGTFWAPTNFFPAAFELAPVSLQFRAELGMLPGGIPRFEACGGN